MIIEEFIKLGHNIDLNKKNIKQYCEKCNVRFIIFGEFVYEANKKPVSYNFIKGSDHCLDINSNHISCNEIIIKRMLE